MHLSLFVREQNTFLRAPCAPGILEAGSRCGAGGTACQSGSAHCESELFETFERGHLAHNDVAADEVGEADNPRPQQGCTDRRAGACGHGCAIGGASLSRSKPLASSSSGALAHGSASAALAREDAGEGDSEAVGPSTPPVGAPGKASVAERGPAPAGSPVSHGSSESTEVRIRSSTASACTQDAVLSAF